MRGKAYAIMRWKDIQDISLSRLNAQEMLMDIALETGYYTFLYEYNFLGIEFKDSMESANAEIDLWRIWQFNLV